MVGDGQSDESNDGVRETSKLGGIRFTWLFPIEVFA
jgi:hypothetical protein